MKNKIYHIQIIFILICLFYNNASSTEQFNFDVTEVEIIENGNIYNSGNYPPTKMSRNGGSRITFSNNNVPKVLGSVLSILADSEINVVDMVNKSRGEIAYNIIDVEGDISTQLKEKIAQVDGVMRVRLL